MWLKLTSSGIADGVCFYKMKSSYNKILMQYKIFVFVHSYWTKPCDLAPRTKDGALQQNMTGGGLLLYLHRFYTGFRRFFFPSGGTTPEVQRTLRGGP